MKKIFKNKIIQGFFPGFKAARDYLKKQVSGILSAFSAVFSSESDALRDRKTNRYLFISLGAIFVLDYIMFCYHAEKNIFSFFPELPVISEQKEVTVYLPALDGKTLLEEKRMVAAYDSVERFILFLFNSVVKGSSSRNTSLAVPARMNIRKIWIMDKGEDAEGRSLCAIDCEVPLMDKEVEPIPGSEPLFKKALQQTITANIPGINGVVLLERGVPDKKLW